MVHSGCCAPMRAQSPAVRSSGCQRFEAGMYRRVAISLGHVDSALQTIYPQLHDVSPWAGGVQAALQDSEGARTQEAT